MPTSACGVEHGYDLLAACIVVVFAVVSWHHEMESGTDSSEIISLFRSSQDPNHDSGVTIGWSRSSDSR